MSDSEEENFCFFGKPLEPYDEDAFPKKKPIALEDQVATDAQGRRRFHGAFTGGFSAGFYNTVGSLEGWTPAEFKSTRQEKAQSKNQKPEDFMDDEDMGQFGIAPQTVRATKDYSTSTKRKRQVFGDGPIPGEPVLHSLLAGGNETIGYLLLKNIGLKSKPTGETSGSQENQQEGRVYGCEMPKTYEISREEDVNQYPLPEIYLQYLKSPKSNTFGLDYTGLSRCHVDLFQTTNLVVKERNKKKLSITGQAFGVGAFEDDDEDIYVKDDMTKYDFELTTEKAAKKSSKITKETILGEFMAAKNPFAAMEIFPAPTIPHSFTGKHKQKKSRFEPLKEPEPVDRRDMNADVRARYLGEETPKSPPKEKPKTEPKKDVIKTEETNNSNRFSIAGMVFDRFVAASQSEDISNILEVVEKSETTHGTQEMRDAAKMKMFGPLTRIVFDWQPCSLLCKRFNVPEPHNDLLASSTTRKRTKNLIFEYEKENDSMSDLKPGLLFKDSVSENAPSTSFAETEANSSRDGGNSILETTNSSIIDTSSTTAKEKEPEIAPKDITEKIDIDKNVDLFKAVFLSSSESEDEEESEEKKDDTNQQELNDKMKENEEMRAAVLSDTLLPKIRPGKDGILSSMDFSIFTQQEQQSTGGITVEPAPASQNQNQEQNNKSTHGGEMEDGSYGPKLPTNIERSLNIAAPETKKKKKTVEDEEEWVEVRSSSPESSTTSRHKKSKKRHKSKTSKKKSHKPKKHHKHKRH